jgi:hypothetical protein
LLPWLVVPDDPSKQPQHREVLPDPKDAEQDLFFEDDPSLVEALQAYIEGPWLKWATIEGPRRKSIGIYDKLFNLLQTIETEGAETALELVWGVGVSVWNTGKHRLRYPLLSLLVEIDPIGNDMALRIRPREVPPILETDPYVAMENAGLPTFEKAARTILDHPDAHLTPFDEASFEQVERAIILEDDCLPDPSFFRFCDEMLERYRDNNRVSLVSGGNLQFGQQRGTGSYYFSKYTHIWGWASWRRACLQLPIPAVFC